MPTWDTTARNISGCCTSSAPINSPPFEPPSMASLALDQQPRRRGEVVEDVLLLREHARAVPALPELASPAEVRDRPHAALLEPGARRRMERRPQAHVVPAIAREQGGRRPVERRALPEEDVHRHLRAVFRHRELALHLDVR